ncbi:hypothetical protein MSAN_00295700 [Mycena sanguinolenta]|uniref:Uncharacterized protein n=1 Tax=Mycena sanguinolenta TaxID=230812 RepID=A0A8H7DJ37_9AGAR|nr:hypothetical protein MSAN_00295700 [Mycena sanguinolenta]
MALCHPVEYKTIYNPHKIRSPRSTAMAPHRDPGPNASEGPVVWCQERASTKTGVSLFVGTIDGHPYLDPWPLSKFTSMKPTALDLANFIEPAAEGGSLIHVFKRASDANPADDGDVVDLNKYGLTMNDPILLVNHHPDAQNLYQLSHAIATDGTDKKDGNSGAGNKRKKDSKKPKKAKERRSSSSSSASSSSSSSSSSSDSDRVYCHTNDNKGATFCEPQY